MWVNKRLLEAKTCRNIKYFRLKIPHRKYIVNFKYEITFELSLFIKKFCYDILNFNIDLHWRIKGGTTGTHPPPSTGSNSFIFAYVFAKKCPRRRSAPPQRLSVPPPEREILDPLLTYQSISNRSYYFYFNSFFFSSSLFPCIQ